MSSSDHCLCFLRISLLLSNSAGWRAFTCRPSPDLEPKDLSQSEQLNSRVSEKSTFSGLHFAKWDETL